MPVLLIDEGHGRTRIEEIKGPRVLLGRSAQADIRINHRKVSKRHALLVSSGTSFLLIDLDSRNGTFLNGERIRTATLKPGDKVTLGRGVTILYEVKERALETQEKEPAERAPQAQIPETTLDEIKQSSSPSTGSLPSSPPISKKPLKASVRARRFKKPSVRIGSLFVVLFILGALLILPRLRKAQNPSIIQSQTQKTYAHKGEQEKIRPLWKESYKQAASKKALREDIPEKWADTVCQTFLGKEEISTKKTLTKLMHLPIWDLMGTLPVVLKVAQASEDLAQKLNEGSLFRIFLRREPKQWEIESIQELLGGGPSLWELAVALASSPEALGRRTSTTRMSLQGSVSCVVVFDPNGEKLRSFFSSPQARPETSNFLRLAAFAYYIQCPSNPEIAVSTFLGLQSEDSSLIGSINSYGSEVWLLSCGPIKGLFPEPFKKGKKFAFWPVSVESNPLLSELVRKLKCKRRFSLEALRRISELRSSLGFEVPEYEFSLASASVGHRKDWSQLLLECTTLILRSRNPSFVLILLPRGVPEKQLWDFREKVFAAFKEFVAAGNSFLYLNLGGESQGGLGGFFLASGPFLRKARIFRGSFLWEDFSDFVLSCAGVKKLEPGSDYQRLFKK